MCFLSILVFFSCVVLASRAFVLSPVKKAATAAAAAAAPPSLLGGLAGFEATAPLTPPALAGATPFAAFPPTPPLFAAPPQVAGAPLEGGEPGHAHGVVRKWGFRGGGFKVLEHARLFGKHVGPGASKIRSGLKHSAFAPSFAETRPLGPPFVADVCFWELCILPLSPHPLNPYLTGDGGSEWRGSAAGSAGYPGSAPGSAKSVRKWGFRGGGV